MILAADMLAQAGDANTDIAIVGSGAVGIALATQLANGGRRVTLVEAGGPEYDPAQQTVFFKAHQLSDLRHPPTELYRRRMLGGTTSVWGGRCIPLDPEDLIPAEGRAGWPITPAEVSAHISDALGFLDAGISEFSFSLPVPPSFGRHCDATKSDILFDRVERWSTPTNVWRKWERVLNNLENLLVVHGATCTEILTTADGNRARGLRLRASSNKTLTLTARVVILACGGLETPRLLLASRSVRSCGLGNERDLVGRYYMTHIVGDVGQLRLNVPETSVALGYTTTPEGVYIRRLILLAPAARQRERLGNIVFRPTIARIDDASHRDSILSAMFLAKRFIIKEYARRLVAESRPQTFSELMCHVCNVACGMPRLLAFALDWTRRRILAKRKLPSVFLLRPDHVYPLEFNAEQTPDFDSCVKLGSDVDPYGIPRLTINWRVSERDLASICRSYEVLQAAIKTGGVGEVKFAPDVVTELKSNVIPQSGHHIGTVRMGDQPATSVVDSNGELWTTKGLFVAGTALFPTSGFANPTLTAVALAFRLAKRLRSQPHI